MPTLTWERRDGQRMVFHLQGIETAIGRDLGNPVRIESGYVSKRHAVIRLGQQGYTLTDLNSSNGTSVNSQRVGIALLRDGDRIELGAEVLVFSSPELGAPQAAAQAGAGRKPLMLIAVGGGGLILILLLVILLFGGSSRKQAETAKSTAPADAATSQTTPANAPSTPPSTGVPNAPADTTLPGTDTQVPDSAAPLPSNNPNELYDMAMEHVQGGRLVEARRLLAGALRIDPQNPSVRTRLQEVENTITATVQQHLANGQRAFSYLKYQDAILEWEQVLSLTQPSDPRYKEAAAGIVRAKERLQ